MKNTCLLATPIMVMTAVIMCVVTEIPCCAEPPPKRSIFEQGPVTQPATEAPATQRGPAKEPVKPPATIGPSNATPTTEPSAPQTPTAGASLSRSVESRRDVQNFEVIAKAAAKTALARKSADAAWVKTVSEATTREIAELELAEKTAIEKHEREKVAAIAIHIAELDSELRGMKGRPADSVMAPKPAARQRGKVVADKLLLVADDLIVDIYLNGERVPDELLKLEREIYGAMVLSARLELHEGDCLAFVVANDLPRWGTCGFSAAALMGTGNTPIFWSESSTGAWCTCESVIQADRFIKDPAYLADRKAVVPDKPWNDCKTELAKRCEYSGDTLWSSAPSHLVWFKYVVPREVAGK